MANKYGKAFITDNVSVTWSHLHKPDTKFGNPNYNITVSLTDDLQQKITDAAAAAGFGKVSKINGIGNREEGKVLKVKNAQYIKDNPGATSFPCVDANAKATKAVPFGGDVVRLKLVPCFLERDGSMSVYLDACQIIEKNEREGSGSAAGFSAVEGGFDGSNAEAPAAEGSNLAEEVVEEDNVDLPF